MRVVISEDKKLGLQVIAEDAFNPGMVEISTRRLVKRPEYVRRRWENESLILTREEIHLIAHYFPWEAR